MDRMAMTVSTENLATIFWSEAYVLMFLLYQQVTTKLLTSALGMETKLPSKENTLVNSLLKKHRLARW